MASADVDGMKALLPGRVQKASVSRKGALVLEVYVHLPSDAHTAPATAGPLDGGRQGVKRWLVVEDGALRWLDERPPRDEEGEPPALQGLVRKELVPSVLASIDELPGGGAVVAAEPGEPGAPGEPGEHGEAARGAVLRLGFTRPADAGGKPRVLLVERTADPRAVLCAALEEQGLRVLATLGGAPRPGDGRDLRRGRLYEAPRAPAAPHAATASRATPAARPLPVVDPALAEARAALRAEARRLKRLVDAVSQDLKRHGEAARHEEDGELLKTVLGRVKRGTSAIDVVDWSGAPRTLTLDPALDGKGNLEALFKRARRARAAVERAAPRLAEAEERLAVVEVLRTRLAPTPPAPGALDEARALLARPETGGSARRKAARAGRRQPWRAFAVALGVVARVGRGARDNDALVKSARGNDLWLHARGHQGAHVIVPSTGADVPADVLLDAAHLAAHFSSARGEGHVDVQTARVKHLRKPGPGAPAGLVHVTHESVVHLRVDDDRVRRLLAAEVPA